MEVKDQDKFCPVCGYDIYKNEGKFPWSPVYDEPSYIICSSCGVEFGYQDFTIKKEDRKKKHKLLRLEWIKNGMRWHDFGVSNPPSSWNPIEQLKNIGIKFDDQGDESKVN